MHTLQNSWGKMERARSTEWQSVRVRERERVRDTHREKKRERERNPRLKMYALFLKTLNVARPAFVSPRWNFCLSLCVSVCLCFIATICCSDKISTKIFAVYSFTPRSKLQSIENGNSGTENSQRISRRKMLSRSFSLYCFFSSALDLFFLSFFSKFIVLSVRSSRCCLARTIWIPKNQNLITWYVICVHNRCNIDAQCQKHKEQVLKLVVVRFFFLLSLARVGCSSERWEDRAHINCLKSRKQHPKCKATLALILFDRMENIYTRVLSYADAIGCCCCCYWTACNRNQVPCNAREKITYAWILREKNTSKERKREWERGKRRRHYKTTTLYTTRTNNRSFFANDRIFCYRFWVPDFSPFRLRS